MKHALTLSLAGLLVLAPTLALADDAPTNPSEVTDTGARVNDTATSDEVASTRLQIKAEPLPSAEPKATPLPASAPVATDGDIRRLKRDMKKAAPHERRELLESTLADRRLDSRNAAVLLALIPEGRTQVEAALFLHLRVTDPAQFHQVFKLFKPQYLAILGETLAERTMARVKVEVVSPTGALVPGAQVRFCDQGPMLAPVEKAIPAEPYAEGCELNVLIDDEVVYTEHFVPQATERFARRLTVEEQARENAGVDTDGEGARTETEED